MSKKRSLADDLAELFNPGPAKEYDPEADPFGAGPALVESDEELTAQLQGVRRAKEKGMRLRGEIELEDDRYRGRRTSRSAAFGSGTDDDSQEEGGSEAEGNEESNLDSMEAGSDHSLPTAGHSSSEEDVSDGGVGDADSSDSEPELQPGARGGGALANGNGMHTVSGESGSEGSGDEGQEPAGPLQSAGDGDEGGELADLEREYEALRVAEAEAAAGLRERASKERQKAQAVQAQQQLWQRGLEMRILLQKGLQGGNRLPQAPVRSAGASQSVELEEAYAGLVEEAVGLTEDLTHLLDTLYQQNGAVVEAATEVRAGRKRPRPDSDRPDTVRQLWQGLHDLYTDLSPFRDASIDRWHRKTTLTTGGAVRSSLKALNQSVSAQVAAMMRDPHKLIERTRLPRLRSRPLCADGEQHDDAPEAMKAAEAEVYEGDEERDVETFEDTEFYQTLLKEFLEGSSTAAAGNWFTGPKNRKVVDRRASKGRKVRYHVHEKLVNFMTPVELEGPQFASHIFSNLFGGSRTA